MEPTDRNLRAWEEAHRRRGESEEGASIGIPEAVRHRLADLNGRHVLHLPCWTGEESVELAGRGALVTAIDPSAEALAAARERAPNVAFVHAELHDLPLELRRGRFDLAYAAEGGLEAVADLDAWAHGLAGALRQGGALLLHDVHPIASCVDALGHWRANYFEETWPLGRIVAALARAGFVVRALEELPGAGRAERIPSEFLLLAEKSH